MTEECRVWVFEACCEGENSVFCAEIAETEHGAVAGEKWEGGVVELGLEGLGVVGWVCGEGWSGVYGGVCTVTVFSFRGEWEGTFFGEVLLLRIGRIAILVLQLLVHMFRGRLESRRSSTFLVEGDCFVGLTHLVPLQPTPN